MLMCGTPDLTHRIRSDNTKCGTCTVGPDAGEAASEVRGIGEEGQQEGAQGTCKE